MELTDSSIRTMILVGGLGTRLRPIVFDRPKPLAMIGDRPFLDILIDSLVIKGLREFILLTGYMGDMIRDHLQLRYGNELVIEFSHEEVPLGTGGAVKNAAKFASDPTVLINGDTFFDADISALLLFHDKNSAAVTLSLVEVEDAGRYGSVNVDSTGRILGFREKDESAPGPGLVNAGVSVLSKDFIESLPGTGAFSMERDVFPSTALQKNMFGLLQQKDFFDIGTPESYAAFEDFVRRRY